MYQGILKGESGLFLTPVLTLWGSGHTGCHAWRRVIVPSDLAPSFGPIYTLSLLGDSPHDNLYASVIKVQAGKAIHAKRNCLVGLATKESRGTITRLHTCGKMAATTDSPIKFPWYVCYTGVPSCGFRIKIQNHPLYSP